MAVVKGLPLSETLKASGLYVRQFKTGSVGFGGKLTDEKGQRFQVTAILIGSRPAPVATPKPAKK